ncbi:hypothetical protein [Mycobacteroides salmoniphilum]|uniref:Replication protein n=1 Tax=Mycobacteroides salmoniphilum TaxID=404941 RepID=A0A4R8T024_9MYCO|nr:hypothetical protein [Mycobacteroides salmoniphilum]TEA09212.1 hypothetical protein CCUG60884_00202 [Mycobacteroides salmoniphilum]
MKTGTSQGKAHPGVDAQHLDDIFVSDGLASADSATEQQSTDDDKKYLSLSEWIAKNGSVPATVVVVARPRWVSLIADWTHADHGSALCGQYKVAARTFMTIATAFAHHCDGSTGRNIAVTNATIAEQTGFSTRLVRTVRRILAVAGWAVEAARGVGHAGGRFNRPSVWHLTMPRPAKEAPATQSTGLRNVVDKTRCGSADFHPLRSSSVENKSSVDQYSPSARGARATRSKPKKFTTGGVAAPLVAHRLADQLATRCRGLDHGHIGALVQALAASHLDLGAWTGAELKSALDLAGQAARGGRGLTWPSQIRRPGAFLAWRLRDLPPRPQRVYVPPPVEAPAPRVALSAAGLAAKAAAFAVLKARQLRR